MSMDAVRQAFLSPDKEYTPIPFWFWNDELSEAELLRQIEDFQTKGVDGFVIHPRKGLPRTMEYLSDRFMGYVRFAVEEAARHGMRVVLYDEAMYPSGSAHGLVVKENPAWASRCLTMEVCEGEVPAADDLIAVCAAQVADGSAADVTLLPPADVYRAPEGKSLLCLREGFSGGTIRGVHEGEDDGEPFAPASADLLNPEAVQAFIRLTHERYYEVLGEYFGSTVIAMFTDEPDIVGRNALPGGKAWTSGFLAEFGDPADLPALWLDVGPETENIRRRYRRAVNRRMLRTYYGQLSAWCEAHHVALTGHPAKGWDIGLLKPFQLPGQDVVWRFVSPGQGIMGDESVLAKCGADAARHSGAPRNTNECFGCCGPEGVQWAFTMDEMKWYMDYLFVRGVNLLYPHAFFYSIRDGRGDERPPDVGPNNLWWPMYGQISLYMKRMSWLMTGVNQARVAVLCEEDRMPWRSVIPLYENQIEFNYLELSRLPECALEDGALCIHKQRYTHIIAGDALPDNLPRDAVITPAAPHLRVSHVIKEGLDFYLLVNEGEEVISGLLRVATEGRAQWWNAWTGEITPALISSQGHYALELGRRESIILCVDPSREPAVGVVTPQPPFVPPQARPLAGAVWTLTRADGASATLTADESGRLPGWETIPGWADYSGWVSYETEVEAGCGAAIDLGDVRAMARIFVGDAEVTFRPWGPFRCELPTGRYRLRVEVANTMANAMEGKPLPSGMLGPVKMTRR